MPTATAIPESSRQAEDELVRSHLPLVHYAVADVAGRLPRHVGRDDLVSAGMAGLAQAARSYDPERGITFARFASVRIKGSILDELRSRDWASRSVRAKARQVASATERLTGALGRSPSTAEVAETLGLEIGEVEAISGDVHRAVVLNLEGLPVDGNAEEILLVGDTSPDDLLADRERQSYLVAAVANLPARLRRVVLGYFVEELPMQVLAEELGVTDSRISQMRAEALVLLRDAINAQLDPEVAPAEVSPRVARKRDAYHGAVAAHTDFRSRLEPASASLANLAAIA